EAVVGHAVQHAQARERAGFGSAGPFQEQPAVDALDRVRQSHADPHALHNRAAWDADATIRTRALRPASWCNAGSNGPTPTAQATITTPQRFASSRSPRPRCSSASASCRTSTDGFLE